MQARNVALDSAAALAAGRTVPPDRAEASPLDRCLNAVERGLTVLVTVLLFVDASLITIAIASRAVFGIPVTWVYELSLVMLVSIVFLGAAAAFQRDEHIGMYALVERWPRALRPCVDALALALVVVFAAVAVWQSVALLRGGVGVMPMSGLSKNLLYLPVVAGLAVIAAIAAIRFAAKPRASQAIALAVLAAVSIAAWLGASSLTGLTQQAPLVVGVIAFVVCLALGLPLAFGFGITTLILISFSPGMVLTTLPLQMVGGVNSFVLLALPFFVLTGGLLTGGGIAASLLRFLGDVTGPLRGGSAITGVAGMYLFSGLSGAKIADVAAVAPVLAPTMRAEGYPDTELVGVLSASAAMGESVPPSLAILVLTSVTSVSTGALFLAGLAPAAAVALCILALIVVRSRALGIARRSQSPTRAEVVKHFAQALPPAGMPVLIFGGIIFGVATPIEASALAVAYGVLLSLAIYRNPLRSVVSVAARAARMSAMLLFLLATTAAFVWVITADGVAGQLASAVTVFAGNRIAFMLATIVLLIVTGAVFEGLPAIVIFAPLLLPIAVQMGIDPLQYSVVIVMAMGVGNFLPPVGIGYFATCTLVAARPDRAARTTFTYMTAALAGIVVIALVPAITTLIPHLAGAR